MIKILKKVKNIFESTKVVDQTNPKHKVWLKIYVEFEWCRKKKTENFVILK